MDEYMCSECEFPLFEGEGEESGICNDCQAVIDDPDCQ